MDSRYPANDTRRYVDASSIPYVVLPKGAFPLPAGTTLKSGCVVCVVDTKTGGYSGAIFADVGRAVGEASIRLAQRLGLTPFSSSRWPKVVGFSGGANDRRFLYLVFPETAIAAPWPVDEIQAQADALFAELGWGGAAQDDHSRACRSSSPLSPYSMKRSLRNRAISIPTRTTRAQGRLRSLDVSKGELLDERATARDPPDDATPAWIEHPCPESSSRTRTSFAAIPPKFIQTRWMAQATFRLRAKRARPCPTFPGPPPTRTRPVTPTSCRKTATRRSAPRTSSSAPRTSSFSSPPMRSSPRATETASCSRCAAPGFSRRTASRTSTAFRCWR